MGSEYTEEDANGSDAGIGPSQRLRAALFPWRRGVMVNASSLSNKGTTESTSFFSQVMDSAAFLMYHGPRLIDN